MYRLFGGAMRFIVLLACGLLPTGSAEMDLTVMGMSGTFELREVVDGARGDAIVVTMDSLREVDAEGNEVGKTQRVKHSISSFASQGFEVAPKESNVSLGSAVADRVDFETRIGASGPSGEVVGTVRVETYLITEEGVMGNGEEHWAMGAGGLKWNIVFPEWNFCAPCGADYGHFLDLTITVTGLGGARTQGDGMSVDMGGNTSLSLASMVELDGNLTAMPAGYPRITATGRRTSIVFRFPKFSSNASYDPLLGSVVKVVNDAASFLEDAVGLEESGGKEPTGTSEPSAGGSGSSAGGSDAGSSGAGGAPGGGASSGGASSGGASSGGASPGGSGVGDAVGGSVPLPGITDDVEHPAPQQVAQPGPADASMGVKVWAKGGIFKHFGADGADPEAAAGNIVSLTSVLEVDAAGGAAAGAGAIAFSDKVFEVTPPHYNVTLGSTRADRVDLSTQLAGTGRVEVETYLVVASGVVGNGDESWPVGVGGMKWNIVLSGWNFSDAGAFLDLTMSVAGFGASAVVEDGVRVDIGGGFVLRLARAVEVDGVLTPMPSGYPKIIEIGSRTSVVLRFPRFDAKVFYDPVISISDAEEHTAMTSRATGAALGLLLSLLLPNAFFRSCA